MCGGPHHVVQRRGGGGCPDVGREDDEGLT
jgi:hypothetical protein